MVGFFFLVGDVDYGDGGEYADDEDYGLEFDEGGSVFFFCVWAYGGLPFGVLFLLIPLLLLVFVLVWLRVVGGFGWVMAYIILSLCGLGVYLVCGVG